MAGGRGAGQPPQLHHRADERLRLERLARFGVLQHRGLVLADPFRTGDALLERHPERDPELRRDSLRLGHHPRGQIARRREPADVDQGRVGERADRVEGEVAPCLEPDFGADVVQHRGLEPGALQRPGQRRDPIGDGAVELPDRKPGPFDVTDAARCGDLGRGIRDAPDDSLRFDRARDRRARVEGVEHGAVERSAVALEVPPGDAVLSRQHDGLGTEQSGELAGDRSDLVRLDPEDHQVLGPTLPHVAGGGDVRGMNHRAVVHRHLEPAASDRLEMATSGDQGDFLAGCGQPRAEQPTDGPCPYDTDLHGVTLSATPAPRWHAAALAAWPDRNIYVARSLRRHTLNLSMRNIAPVRESATWVSPQRPAGWSTNGAPRCIRVRCRPTENRVHEACGDPSIPGRRRIPVVPARPRLAPTRQGGGLLGARASRPQVGRRPTSVEAGGTPALPRGRRSTRRPQRRRRPASHLRPPSATDPVQARDCPHRTNGVGSTNG